MDRSGIESWERPNVNGLIVQNSSIRLNFGAYKYWKYVAQPHDFTFEYKCGVYQSFFILWYILTTLS